MSFASILGPSNNEPSPKLSEAKQTPTKVATPQSKPCTESKVVAEQPAKVSDLNLSRSFGNGDVKPRSNMETVPVAKKYEPPPPPRMRATNEELEKISKALNAIDETSFSDVEDAGWDEHMQRYKQRSRRGAAAVHESELHKRKVSN